MDTINHEQDELINQNTFRELKELGIDVDHVILCLGGNETVYLSICKKFLKDSSFQRFRSAWDINDLKSALIHIHTLKGVTSNLGFIHMELLCKYILEDLKNNDVLCIQQYISQLSEEYDKIINVLK